MTHVQWCKKLPAIFIKMLFCIRRQTYPREDVQSRPSPHRARKPVLSPQPVLSPPIVRVTTNDTYNAPVMVTSVPNMSPKYPSTAGHGMSPPNMGMSPPNMVANYPDMVSRNPRKEMQGTRVPPEGEENLKTATGSPNR